MIKELDRSSIAIRSEPCWTESDEADQVVPLEILSFGDEIKQMYALKGHWKLFLHVVCIERILEVVLAWKEIEHSRFRGRFQGG